jgi:hypothetical protein
MILTHNHSAQQILSIPLPVYMICVFVQHGSAEIGFTAICLVYGTKPFLSFARETPADHPTDVLAFSVIVYLVVRSNVNKVPVPSLLRTIAEDATYYFLVVFTSHLVAMMFLLFASVSMSS